MTRREKTREGLNRTNYAMLIGIVYLIAVDFFALFLAPGTLGVWRLAGFAYLMIVLMIRFTISEGHAEVAMDQHERMWHALAKMDPERASIANENDDFPGDNFKG